MLENNNEFTNACDNGESEDIKEILEKSGSYDDMIIPICNCANEEIGSEYCCGEIDTECSCDEVESDTTPNPLPDDYFKDYAAPLKPFPSSAKTILENTQIKETVSFDMDEEISNAIKFLSIKVNSYSNLFATYMNSSVAATPNSIVLDSFLEKFTAANVEIEDFKTKNCKKILGEEGYEYLINNPFRYNFNFDLNKLQVTRMGSISDNNGCSCNK